MAERFKDEKVPPGAECPMCRENRLDELIWDEDEQLHCASCGAVYDPNTTPITILGFDAHHSSPADPNDLLAEISETMEIDPTTLIQHDGQLFTPNGNRVYAIQLDGRTVYVTIPQ